MPNYFIEDFKTFSTIQINLEKEIKGIKFDKSYIKKKKETEGLEIKKCKENILKLELSRRLLRIKQKEVQKSLYETMSAII